MLTRASAAEMPKDGWGGRARAASPATRMNEAMEDHRYPRSFPPGPSSEPNSLNRLCGFVLAEEIRTSNYRKALVEKPPPHAAGQIMLSLGSPWVASRNLVCVYNVCARCDDDDELVYS
jgi:hypothetical protein